MDLARQMTAIPAIHQGWEFLRWHKPYTPGYIRPDKHWLDWLTDSSSLTRRLQHVSHGQFRVQLLSQDICRPAHHEAHQLALPLQQKTLIRQVLLCNGQQPWVFARTIIPLPTLAKNRYLLNLGNRSLGHVLFRKHAGAQRAPLEITPGRLTKTDARDLPLLFTWGRRSCFEINQAPLLVTELFLETFRQHQQLSPLRCTPADSVDQDTIR